MSKYIESFLVARYIEYGSIISALYSAIERDFSDDTVPLLMAKIMFYEEQLPSLGERFKIYFLFSKDKGGKDG